MKLHSHDHVVEGITLLGVDGALEPDIGPP